MTKVNWKQFERLVAAIHNCESQGAEVKWNDVIDGRQFDVTIRFKYGLHDYLTVIECKNYSHRVPVEKLDALATKYKDIKANKAVMVSSNGYQSGCIDVAKRHGIRLLTLNETINEDVELLIKEPTPALNIYDVRLIKESDGREYELENVGGRLAYLMGHVKITTKDAEITPAELVNKWQMADPRAATDKERDVGISFPTSTMAHIPYEDSFLVKALRFKCKVVDAIIADKPSLDNHIRESHATAYELRGAEDNELECSKNLTDLELGYDTKLEEGKFYVIPSLFNYYYCESINNGLVSWILVECHQHGKLLRARITQKEEYSSHYVEVKDKRILSRLKKLLDEYNSF